MEGPGRQSQQKCCFDATGDEVATEPGRWVGALSGKSRTSPHKALCNVAKCGANVPFPQLYLGPSVWASGKRPDQDQATGRGRGWGWGPGRQSLSAGGDFLTFQPAASFREGVVCEKQKPTPMNSGRKGMDSPDIGQKTEPRCTRQTPRDHGLSVTLPGTTRPAYFYVSPSSPPLSETGFSCLFIIP